MHAVVKLYSVLPNEIERFLNNFSGIDNNEQVTNSKQWQKDYQNPIEIADIIGIYIENIDIYNIAMWISIDNGVFIKVTQDNSDELIRYLFERFPY